MEGVEIAKQIATEAHKGQFRRDGVTPYIKHPEEVAKRVSGDPDAEAVAWLHDVIEDTDMTREDLAIRGVHERIIVAVERLTKTKGMEYRLYLDQIIGDPLATKVKLADMEANLDDDPTDHQRAKYAKGMLKLMTNQ